MSSSNVVYSFSFCSSSSSFYFLSFSFSLLLLLFSSSSHSLFFFFFSFFLFFFSSSSSSSSCLVFLPFISPYIYHWPKVNTASFLSLFSQSKAKVYPLLTCTGRNDYTLLSTGVAPDSPLKKGNSDVHEVRKCSKKAAFLGLWDKSVADVRLRGRRS